ncbi:nuclear transport factor 2 family protein [Naasia lichenicola]|uniref:Nuclear transport factor 2 family protein n=1 Tax=Naasia lichenicola TaxID=2565933 RepID=A0A4V3WTK2_9MICO|nr:nuclear transport factor 2 family protein [Naasia lichenicola]THG32327.1 nuclear transport factor 2 family protein [Naasia lichenicola]
MTITKDDVRAWVAGYEKAWTSNEPEDIRALFAPGAEYRFEPFSEPEVDIDAIIASWLDHRDEPGTWTFDSEVIAIEGDLGVVEGRTVYGRLGTAYRNLWLIRLDDGGRATMFTEYYAKEPEVEQAAAVAGAV